jgi:integrase
MTTVKVSDVLSFLQTLVEKKRAKTTIRVAHAALVHYFVLHGREEIIRSPVVDFHVKGAQRLAPRVQKKVLIWDPEVPLTFLRDKSRPTLFLPAAREALLLLLLATGIRVSDAARLSKELTVVNGVCAIEYLEDRKTGTSPAQLVREYSVDRLCPVRALKHYLNLAASRASKDEKFLFISSTGSRAAVDTLRKGVIKLLSDAGVTATAGSCRSASTSAAFLRDLPIDEILSAAGWKHASTFRRYYQRLVHPRASGVSLLPPAE